MPTINFSLKDLQKLIGKKIDLKELEELIRFCKGEISRYDKTSDEITAEFADTNLPYLWSVEGIARFLKGVVGKEKGIAKINIKKSNYEIIVDGSVSDIRPYIVSFAASGKKVDDYLIKQIIQLQEKLCENFGRRRQKVAIGIYRLNKIKFPVYYKATDPESIQFIPLDFKRPLTQQEILEEHPKGKEYAWILKGVKKYPILVDSENNVLSFPPIINSIETGKIEEGDSELFFEATGTDLKALNLAANIFAYALYERGFDVYSVNIKYVKCKEKLIKTKSIKTPQIINEKIKIKKEDVEKLIGLSLNDAQIKNLLEKARYGFNAGVVEIPSYRGDILHAVDVIEDISIMYGYDKLKGIPLTEYTTGRTFEIVKFINNIRELMVGNGYQEIMSPILCNKKILYDAMNIKDFGTVEIANPMSETFSCVRTWLIPILMEVLSKNKHADYPQKIFEEGIVTLKKDGKIIDYERLAVVSAHNNANFTEIKQILDYIMNLIGVKYEIEEIKHDSFIEGRVGRVSVNGKNIAFIGEINPIVLKNFNLAVPVSAFEINLTELFEIINKN